MNALAQLLAGAGRHGDTVLAHVTPRELMLLRQMGGAGSVNPATGMPEFFTDDGFDGGGHSAAHDAAAGMGVDGNDPSAMIAELEGPAFSGGVYGGPGWGGGPGGALGTAITSGPLAGMGQALGANLTEGDRAFSQIASATGLGAMGAIGYGLANLGGYGINSTLTGLGFNPTYDGVQDFNSFGQDDNNPYAPPRSGVSAGTVPLATPNALAPPAPTLPNTQQQGGANSLARLMLARNARGGSPRLYGNWRY